jgi:hypothetical protein
MATKIYLATGAMEMRKGFQVLHGLVRDRLGSRWSMRKISYVMTRIPPSLGKNLLINRRGNVKLWHYKISTLAELTWSILMDGVE